MLTDTDFLRLAALLRHFGLFVALLNNGDFVAGRAADIYHLDIRADHHCDPRFHIHYSLKEAVYNAIAAIEKERRNDYTPT